MSLNDRKKSEKTDPFGSGDRSYIAQFLRGEVEVEHSNSVPEEHPIFWETMSIHSDGTIKNCVLGQYKHEFPLDTPKYSEILLKVKEQFPDIEEGKICTLRRYRDGRTVIETEDLMRPRN